MENEGTFNPRACCWSLSAPSRRPPPRVLPVQTAEERITKSKSHGNKTPLLPVRTSNPARIFGVTFIITGRSGLSPSEDKGGARTGRPTAAARGLCRQGREKARAKPRAHTTTPRGLSLLSLSLSLSVRFHRSPASATGKRGSRAVVRRDVRPERHLGLAHVPDDGDAPGLATRATGTRGEGDPGRPTRVGRLWDGARFRGPYRP